MSSQRRKNELVCSQVRNLERFARAKAAGDLEGVAAITAHLGEKVGGVPLETLESMLPSQVLALTKSAKREIDHQDSVIAMLKSGGSSCNEDRNLEVALGEAAQLLHARSTTHTPFTPPRRVGGFTAGSPGLNLLANLVTQPSP